MKQVTTMPQEGQFVAVWEYNGDVWSDVLRWKLISDGETGKEQLVMERYDSEMDFWGKVAGYQDVYDNALYFVAGE